jgi:hypothetical protein
VIVSFELDRDPPASVHGCCLIGKRIHPRGMIDTSKKNNNNNKIKVKNYYEQ